MRTDLKIKLIGSLLKLISVLFCINCKVKVMGKINHKITNSAPPQALRTASHTDRPPPLLFVCILTLIVLFGFYFAETGDQNIIVLIFIIIAIILTVLVIIVTIIEFKEHRSRTRGTRQKEYSAIKRPQYLTGDELSTCVKCGSKVFPLICRDCGLSFCVSCSKEHTNEEHQDDRPESDMFKYFHP